MRKLLKLLFATAALGAGAGLSASADDQVVLFETTHGNFVVETYSAKAPITVENFLNLVNSRFYEGIIFHRVIAGFVIQAGGYNQNMQPRDPSATIKNESSNGLLNLERTLSMARTSDPDSASSQFFVNLMHNTHLDYQEGAPGYAVFAKVIGGWDVIESIAAAKTAPGDKPIEAIVIHKAALVDRATIDELLD